MSDQEVLDSLKRSLTHVHMERPLATIVARGRARRRNRAFIGAAGAGLAVAAGVAVVAGVALATPAPGTADRVEGRPAQPVAEAPSAGRMATEEIRLVGVTLSRAPDNTVTLTFDKARPAKKQLESALLKIGGHRWLVGLGRSPCDEPKVDAPSSYVVERRQADGTLKLVVKLGEIPQNGVLNIFIVTDRDDVPQIAMYGALSSLRTTDGWSTTWEDPKVTCAS